MEEKARMAQPPTSAGAPAGSGPPRRRKLKVVPNTADAPGPDQRLPDSQASPIPALAAPQDVPALPRPAAAPHAVPKRSAETGAVPSSAYPSNIDVEALTKNFARLIEEGGRAVAAYLKPREDGTKKVGYSDEVADAVKTLGQVMEYWYADPQRTVEMQTMLGKSYLGLFASASRRLAGEPADPVAKPDPRDKRFNDPEWSSNQ